MNYINFTLLITLFLSSTLMAQDAIIKQNGEQIKCKVEELTETTIKYRKFEKSNGPIYNINKAEVVVINYEDGTTEVIPQKQQNPKAKLSFNRTQGNQDREKEFQFFDRSITANFVSYEDFKGFSLDYEENVFADNLSLRIPLYFVFNNGYNVISTGLNLKYYIYQDTWIRAFVGPEVNIGYLQSEDLERLGLDVINLQVLADSGVSITPIDHIKITAHIGLGYGSSFIVAQESNRSANLDKGFAFNFNVGIGYNF